MDNLENVYAAIQCMSGSNPTQTNQAAVFLATFQKSIYAWSTSDIILAQKRNYQSSYFAAQTMRQKILYDFKELPKESYISLRDSIINHLKSVDVNSENSSIIITQLSLALADLYLQIPEWNNFISEILTRFAQGPGTNLNVMLNLLKVLPEELQNRHLKLGENRRTAVEKELAVESESVFGCLKQITETYNSDMVMLKKVIQCLGAWLVNRQCPTDALAASPLMHSVLHILIIPNCPQDLFEAVSECLVNACLLIDDTRKHPKLAIIIQQGVYASVEIFNKAKNEEDLDKLQALSRIYVEFCESILEDLVNDPGTGFGDLRSLDLLLLISDFHDYSLVDMTFNLWYRLSEFLYQVPIEGLYDDLIGTFRPYVEKYIAALYKHCRLDTDHEGILDEKDDFGEFRGRVSESIKDVAFITGSINLAEKMLNTIREHQNGTWDEIESALFITSTFIHNVTESDDEIIPQICTIIYGLPQNAHPQLLNSAIQVFANLQDWLQCHPDYQENTIRFLLQHSSNELVIRTISDAIENICMKGYEFLRAFFDSLLQLVHNIEKAPRHGHQMEQACGFVLRATTWLINDLPTSELAMKLNKLCEESLAHLIGSSNGIKSTEENNENENIGDSWKRLSNDPVLWIDRIAAIFRILKPWQNQAAFKEQSKLECNGNNNSQIPCPWLDLSTKMWRTLSQTMDQHQGDLRIVEHCCRAIRFIIRSMGIQSVIFVDELANQILKIYANHPHSCFLYLASILVDEYAANGMVLPGLLSMLDVLCNCSFKILSQENGLLNYPDTVDDLYRLGIRFVQRAPSAFFQQSAAALMFECGVHALELDHQDANKSVSKFFIEGIDSIRNAQKAGISDPGVLVGEALFLRYGDQVVWHALNGSLFVLSHGLGKDMAEIIHNIGNLSKEKQSEWLMAAVTKLPHDTGLSANRSQLEEFHAKVVRSERLIEVANAIRDLSRLYN